VYASSANRLVTRNASLVVPPALAYRERILAVQASPSSPIGNWFGGEYIDEKNFFANSWSPTNPTWPCTGNPHRPGQKKRFCASAKAPPWAASWPKLNWKLGTP
jgi:hypothetical protein